MTRDEAKKEFWEQNGVFEKRLDINYEKVIKSYFVGSEFDKFIDKIFDDIESRTCKNCKYFEVIDFIGNTCSNPKLLQDEEMFVDRGLFINVREDFGCNRFERRT